MLGETDLECCLIDHSWESEDDMLQIANHD